jgi:hypothetical protein
VRTRGENTKVVSNGAPGEAPVREVNPDVEVMAKRGRPIAIVTALLGEVPPYVGDEGAAIGASAAAAKEGGGGQEAPDWGPVREPREQELNARVVGAFLKCWQSNFKFHYVACRPTWGGYYYYIVMPNLLVSTNICFKEN